MSVIWITRHHLAQLKIKVSWIVLSLPPLMISSNAIFDFSLLFFHELKSMQSTMLNNSLLLCPSYTFKPSKLFCFLILLNECYTNLLWYNIILYSIFFLYDHTSILTFSFMSLPLFSHVVPLKFNIHYHI